MKFIDIDDGAKTGEKVLLWLRKPYDRAEFAAWVPAWNKWHPDPDALDLENDEVEGIGAAVPIKYAKVERPQLTDAEEVLDLLNPAYLEKLVLPDGPNDIDWSAPLEFEDGTPIKWVENWHHGDVHGFAVYADSVPAGWHPHVNAPTDQNGTVILPNGTVLGFPSLPRVRNRQG